MQYQPRRVSDLGEAPTKPVDVVDDSAAELESVPRRVAHAVGERLLRLSAVVAVALAVLATSGVLIGSSGGTAVALGLPSSSASSSLGGGDAILTGVGLKADTASVPLALTRLYAKASLNIRAEADENSKLLGELDAASEVEATSEVKNSYRRIVFKDDYGWVLADELSDSASAALPAGTTMARCSRGAAVEKNLRKGTVFIYRSVCDLFSAVNSFGGWRAGGMQFHKNGRALDIMITQGKESALGWRIAKYLIAHASVFKIDHVIFEQKIWTPSSPTWTKMANRGSATANHMDHVHVAIK
jgi:hypothetical protein